MIRAAALALLALAPAGDPVGFTVVPSKADPNVKAFDDPNYIFAAPGLPADAPLVIFLPGTNGKPEYNADLMRFVAKLGYRAIALSYDDDPAVVQRCPADPDPDCASDFREMRVFGTGKSRAVSNPVAEAIVPRAVALLRLLDRGQPKAGWAAISPATAWPGTISCSPASRRARAWRRGSPSGRRSAASCSSPAPGKPAAASASPLPGSPPPAPRRSHAGRPPITAARRPCR
jgi:hypothetical protein